MLGGTFAALLLLYTILHFSFVQTWVVEKITHSLSLRLNTTVQIKRVHFTFFNKLELENVYIEDQNEDTLVYIDNIIANIEHIRIKEKKINLSSLTLENTKLNAVLYEDRKTNFSFILEAFKKDTLKESSFNWELACKDFDLENTRISYANNKNAKLKSFELKDMSFVASNFIANRDSIYSEISNLHIQHSKGFEITNMDVHIKSKDKVLSINELNLSTNYSEIANLHFSIDQSKLSENDNISKALFNLSLGKTRINMQDVSFFVPRVQKINSNSYLSGNISGSINNLKGKDIQIQRGENTIINCSFYASGLSDVSTAFFDMKLKKSTLDLYDFKQLMSSEKIMSNALVFNMIDGAGVIKYDGSFIGYINDFVANGDFRTNYGNFIADLSFSPIGQNEINVKGHLSAKKLTLAQLTDKNLVGTSNFEGKVNGLIGRDRKFKQAHLSGVIDSLYLNNYCYKHIEVDGLFKEKEFKGSLIVEDENLQMDFNGLASYGKESPSFNFLLDISHANLQALNLIKNYKEFNLNLLAKANYYGVSFEKIIGELNILGGELATEHGSFKLDDVSILNAQDNGSRLFINSPYLNYKMYGEYKYMALASALKNALSHYLPSITSNREKRIDNNVFNFELSAPNLSPILTTLLPNLSVGNAYALGTISENNNSFMINAKANEIETKTFSVSEVFLDVDSKDILSLVVDVGKLKSINNTSYLDAQLITNIADNQLENKLLWTSPQGHVNSGEIKNTIRLKENKETEIETHSSEIIINENSWFVHPSTIHVYQDSVLVSDFLIENSMQSFHVNGLASASINDSVMFNLKNINLENINPFISNKHQFNGGLNGCISMYSLLEKAQLVGSIDINEFVYNQTEIGNIELNTYWDKVNRVIDGNLNIEQLKGGLMADIHYNPERDSLNINATADSLSLRFLSPLLSSVFKNINGYSSGEVKIHGQLSKILFDGDLYTTDANIALNELNVDYKFSDYIKFRSDSIIFDRIKISDKEAHTGLLNGYLVHTNFSNMIYNIDLNSTDLMILNTTPQINEQFYGVAYGRGQAKISGEGTSISIIGGATTLANTDVSVAPYAGDQVNLYNFLTFVNNDETPDALNFSTETIDSKGGIDMKFNVSVTPDAKFQLVFNSQIGDVMQARGTGDLQIEIDPDFNIRMYGGFEAAWGDYLFTLRNVFNKRFSIERGSTIRWSGSPYDADLDIKAIYNIKAPLSDLVADSYSSYDVTQRIPVVCYIILQNELSSPDISFDIEFPSVDSRIQEELKQYMSTEEDLNRQMLSLLLMGSFYTPEYLQGTYSDLGVSFMGSTTSELLSNQLSNWLSAISDNFDLGINYRRGNNITNDEVELALSTQLFNNRVTLNGNISNNANTTGSTNTNNTSAFVGDFDILVALTKNGKLQLKAYNHSNNNIIYETSPYVQGLGLSYREEFNSWRSLKYKIRRLFKKESERRSFNEKQP